MRQKETIPLIAIYVQEGYTYVEWGTDTNKYEVLGILKTYTKALQEKITIDWLDQEEKE